MRLGIKFLTGSTRSLGPRCSPETQQNREDKVSSSRPVMVRVLRVVATAAADSRFSGIQLRELSGLFGIYNPNGPVPPFSASGGPSFPIYAQLAGEKTRGGEGLNRTGWGCGNGKGESISEPFWFLVSGQDTPPGAQLAALPAQPSEEASPKAPAMLVALLVSSASSWKMDNGGGPRWTANFRSLEFIDRDMWAEIWMEGAKLISIQPPLGLPNSCSATG